MLKEKIIKQIVSCVMVVTWSRGEVTYISAVCDWYVSSAYKQYFIYVYQFCLHWFDGVSQL